MKKPLYSMLAATYALFVLYYCFPGIIHALADVVIIDHMMTRNPQWNSGCSIPIPTDTFTSQDKEADCWFFWDNASAGAMITCQWYKPDGKFYAQQETITPYATGCWYTRILINGYPPANIPGEWRVEVYFEEDLKLTEHFTIHGDTPTEPCPAELLYGDHADETELLRNIRDIVLSQTPEGREIITLYYQYGPVLAQEMRKDVKLKQEVKKMVDVVLGLEKQSGTKKDEH